jgi:hypothetical protein
MKLTIEIDDEVVARLAAMGGWKFNREEIHERSL